MELYLYTHEHERRCLRTVCPTIHTSIHPSTLPFSLCRRSQPALSLLWGLGSNLCPRPIAYDKYLADRVSSLLVFPSLPLCQHGIAPERCRSQQQST